MPAQILLVERIGAGAYSAATVREAAPEPAGVRVVTDRRSAVQALDGGAWSVVVAAVDNPDLPGAAVLELLRPGGPPLILLCDDASLPEARRLARKDALEVVLRREEWMLGLAIGRSLARGAHADGHSGARPADDWSRRVLDQLADGVVTLDAAGRVSFMNTAAKELFGLSRARTVGLDAGMVLPAHWRNIVDYGAEDVTAYRTDGSAFVVELDLRRANLLGQHAHVATLRDVAQRRALERQLQQAQRLDAVAALSRGFTHEFNNILTGVMTYSGIVRRDLGDDHPCAEDLAEIEGAAERAADLVRQMQTLARPATAATTRLDLNEVVGRATGTLANLVGPDVSISVDRAEGLPKVLADHDQVAHVIHNLVLNARDAVAGTDGRIFVTTRLVQVPEPRRGLLPVLPGSYVEITVEDTGEGMEPTTLQRCFDPFFTTRAGRQRSGLGLPIVHAILRVHGGYIDVDSERGKGTRVVVGFPVNSPAPPSEDGVDAPREFSGNERILLAEDDVTVRGVIERILENNGYKVECVEHGLEALSVFTQRPWDFDAAVLDLMMPEMGGAEAYDHMVRIRPDLRVLWVSGFSGGSPLRIGPHTDFLAKPFNPKDLVRRLRLLLDRTATAP